MGLLVVALLCLVAVVAGDASLAEKCSSQFQKVTQCLPFATSKAATPSKDCCASVTDLKSTDPACLCFIIQQIHNGSNPAIKSMGIQEARLLQLPSACSLANASVADCPSLLHLPPNSSDAAIFTNVSSATTTPVATPGGASSSSTTTTTTTPSNGFSHTPQLTQSVAAAALAVIFLFVNAFPTSEFHSADFVFVS